MAVVNSGLDWKGEPCEFHIDDYLKESLDEIKEVVGSKRQKGKNWDYIALVCGNPGTGKSNFAQNCAKYCDPDFNIKKIAFNFLEFDKITNECEPNSAIILDESFADMNTRASRGTDFTNIINKLQLIRQKNLYVFLCLPNFFDLAKGIAIFRSQHLFVTYSQSFGERGTYAAFDRESKKALYILGGKFMNYNACEPNFRGRFVKSKSINEEEYDKLKAAHLITFNDKEEVNKHQVASEKLVYWIKTNCPNMTINDIADIAGVTDRTIERWLARVRLTLPRQPDKILPSITHTSHTT